MNNGPMLNAYPDSIGGHLSALADFLENPTVRQAFSSLYLLPSVFNTDLDRGFSVISYDLSRTLASPEAMERLRELGLELTLDIVLNHLSVLSPQFRDILRRGDASPYRNFFIDWNRFWQGCGPVEADGVLHPGPEHFLAANLRKKGLPVLTVRLPDGRDVPYWNTFYQRVLYPAPNAIDLLDAAGGDYGLACRLAERIGRELAQGKAPREMDWTGLEACRAAACALLENRRQYMGQMDVNIQSPLVWEWYDGVMGQLADCGASAIRLDAFTRLHKAPGRPNFLNEPETWELLARLREMAEAHGLEVLPEIHIPYAAGVHRRLAALGCRSYDYFLPGLLIDAIDTADAAYLCRWAREQIENRLHCVNMLGCHDGIPLRDLKGLLPEERREALAERVCARGGYRKLIHGDHPETYQLDCTYYTALGGREDALLLARAVQLFMPGKPQVWYLDLLAGQNDPAALTPGEDTREINRTALTAEEAARRLELPIVQRQLRLLALRREHPAFAEAAQITAVQPEGHLLRLIRECGGHTACLLADFKALRFEITLDGERWN